MRSRWHSCPLCLTTGKELLQGLFPIRHRRHAGLPQGTLLQPRILRFGGFPEPYLSGNDRFCNRWRNARRDLIFHEDLRDLSRVQDIRGIRALADLLAARVTGGINYSGLAVDLQVTPDTVKAWIGLLESVYEVYTVRPWVRNVANTIRKQPKVYFWDWSTVRAGGMRNENLIASHSGSGGGRERRNQSAGVRRATRESVRGGLSRGTHLIPKGFDLAEAAFPPIQLCNIHI